jgi:rhodanese-related sulfurtransferase
MSRRVHLALLLFPFISVITDKSAIKLILPCSSFYSVNNGANYFSFSGGTNVLFASENGISPWALYTWYAM